MIKRHYVYGYEGTQTAKILAMPVHEMEINKVQKFSTCYKYTATEMIRPYLKYVA